MEHNTPKLEERIDAQQRVNKAMLAEITDTMKRVDEFKKQLNTGMLRVNELNLLKNIRDGKWKLFDVEKLDFVDMKWV